MPRKNEPAKKSHPWRRKIYPTKEERLARPLSWTCGICGVPDSLPHADGCVEYRDALGDLYRK